MSKSTPKWFSIGEEATPQVMQHIADAVSANAMSPQVKFSPTLAHWFILDTLLLSNTANRDGMHANALALLRQCIEAISVIELGICQHKDAETMLLKWDADEVTPGKLRSWLQDNVWVSYGTGLWNEPWHVFMREFAAAIQPYAHYCRNLAQWQLRLHGFVETEDSDGSLHGLIELRPRAYDSQKATRITLFHALITYMLGRIWMTTNHHKDKNFVNLITRLGVALGKSRYLDGHSTDWGQQFWAMLWEHNGGTLLE